MHSTSSDAGRDRADDVGGSAVVPSEPPPWVARAAGWIAVVVFVVAAVAAFVVRLPETVECECVVVAARGPGVSPDAGAASEPVAVELRLEERHLSRVAPGQRVRLLLTALPFARYGSLPAQIVSVGSTHVASPEGPRFVVTARLDAPTVGDGDERRPVRAGMTGTARIAVGSRTIADGLFSPMR